MEKAVVNKFTLGLSADLDKAMSPGESYLDANNLLLTGNNKFYALENLAGTSVIMPIISTFTGKVLGAFACKVNIAGVNIDSILVFTSVSGGMFKIMAVEIVTNNVYELYQESSSAAYETSRPQIDAVVYPENGTDIVYFTDGYNEIRKIRLNIPSPYVANYLTEEQISLQRRATLSRLELTDIIAGGSLLCGSYQFSLRLYNEDTKTYTRWQIPSSPINISRDPSSTELSVGGYGTIASKKIQLKFYIPDGEITNWTHYQFSVIENTSSASLVNASLLKLEDLTGGSSVSGFTSFNFEYNSNIKIGETPITDIVVDLAPIKLAKTIQTKNNRLFVANVEIDNLEYDNGEPSVSGNVLKRVVSNKDDFDTSSYRGYYRDEVYRFYITYFDDKYNLSRPKVLNMSAVTDNQIVGAVDMKFKSRKKAGYTVLNSSDEIINLNLSLILNNHPSWSRGFHIFRAKRKKKIKFQSPFVPSCLIEGVEVAGDYPTTFQKLQGDGSGLNEQTISSASPMNPVGTHVPKNFFFPVRKDYVRLDHDNDPTQKGEVYVQAVTLPTTSNGLFYVFPPNVYNSGTQDVNYTFSTGDSFNVADYAFLRLDYTSFSVEPPTTTEDDGNYLDTSVHGTFKSLFQSDYYYSWTVDRSDPSLPDKTGEIQDFKEFDAYGEGTSISGLSVNDHFTLVTNGISYNTSPANQRIGVMKLKSDKIDSSLYGKSTYGGNQLTSSDSSTVSLTRYQTTEDEQRNAFTYEVAAVGATTRVGILDIVNIVNDLDDTRYGDVEDLHDMIYTGTTHVYNASQLTAVQLDGNSPITVSVAGGDCYVSLHQFKITDSHYGLANIEKRNNVAVISQDGLLKRWEKMFKNKYYSILADGRGFMSMPLPYKNVSQIISTYIESEILGEVLDVTPYEAAATTGLPLTETGNEYKLRIAFPYLYNIGYSKEANQKTLIPFDDTDQAITDFKARGYFSDTKVYGTGIDGFDIFRAASTFDLDETYGGVTKLALSADNMIALQEAGIAYLPIDSDAVATADGGSLSIRSGEVTGVPIYLSRQYGCQHLRGVRTSDTSMFFPDNNNQAVIKLNGNQLEPIYEKGMIANFNTLFASDINVQEMFGVWDNNKRQYWIVTPTKCYVWDDRLDLWVGNHEFGTRLRAGNFVNNKLHLIGVDTDLKVYTMYTGNYSSLMGTTVTPRVTISINPEYEIPKTFDNITAYSSLALATVDIETEIDSGTNQSVSGMVFALNREGNFRIATLRDSSNARLRGLRAIGKFYWPTTNTKISLSQILCKYRPSSRIL